MKLLSINIGAVTAIPEIVKSSGATGIFKQPVEGVVRISENGVESDTIVDKKNHGGADQAVYVYGSADYDWWAAQDQSLTLTPGTFGENLTISDLESAALNIGDRLQVGAALLEVTAPRIPCATFAYKMRDPQWVKRFQKAERPGVYCRVITPGEVQASDPVTLTAYQGETVSALEMFRRWYHGRDDEDFLRRALAAPIAHRARRDYERRLAALSIP
jgi:MOSC domain-containing protein YiiM